MIKTNSLVLYKNSAAIVKSDAVNGKFSIKYMTSPASSAKSAVFSEQNVRSKDIILLHEGPASSLEKIISFAESQVPSGADLYKTQFEEGTLCAMAKEVHELLVSDDETKNASFTFEELASLIKDGYSCDESFALYLVIKNTVFFAQNLTALLEGKLIFTVRSDEEIDALVKKADEKGKEALLRNEFIQRLKKNQLLPEDSKYMVDVEALALGKTDKSRTLHDAAIKETPEKAHKVLLDTGIWDITRNPYPVRWGLSMQSASEGLSSPPQEERLCVEGISYAIDNAWSTDPDDAVAFDGKYVWVHIADPASTVMPDSAVDKSARARGSTLYIPEGAARMLCENALTDYALGLTEKSRALSFRLELDENANLIDCQVFKSIVNVKRLTYEDADGLKDSAELKSLFEIARKNIERRNKAGAVQIEIPEVHITVDPQTKKVEINPAEHPESSFLVREMMLLAGEGAAKFAFKNNIPFPFVSQETPDIPSELPEGLAREFRLRRCMRKRNVGLTPAIHSGLGLAMYSQVTSPLRRYSDLIAHMQLRAFLDGRELLNKDTMLLRVSEGDAASVAAHQAERKSNLHWTLVYLLQNPSWTGQAVCVDKGTKGCQFFIPSLALETYMTPAEEVDLNSVIMLKVKEINLPELSIEFSQIIG